MPAEMFSNTHMLTVMIIGWSIIGMIAIFGCLLHLKRKTKILSTKKLVIISLFLGLFLLQAYLSQIFSSVGISGGQIPFSLNTVTVIVIGIVFGPTEGILYGILADTLSVFIKGYSWDPLNALIYPLYGSLAGIGKEIYYKFKKNTSKNFSIIISQVPITSILIASLIVASNSEALERADVVSWIPYTFGTLVFVLLEIALIWFYIKEDKEKLFLFMVIIFTTIIGRIIGGWYIRSLGQTLWTSTPIELIIMGRIITTSYMTPINAIISYWVINASLYAIKITDWNK